MEVQNIKKTLNAIKAKLPEIKTKGSASVNKTVPHSFPALSFATTEITYAPFLAVPCVISMVRSSIYFFAVA